MSGSWVLLGGDSLAGRELVERLETRGLAGRLHLVSTDAELATLSVSAGELRAHTPDLTDALADAQVAVVCSEPGAEQAERLMSAAREMPVLDLTGRLDGVALDARAVTGLEAGCWSSPTASALIGAALIRAASSAGAAGTPHLVALEPLSALGGEAVDEMHGQAVALLNFTEMPTETLGAQAVHDASSPGREGAARERRLRRELAELSDRPVSALRVQAGLFHGSALALRCELSAADWKAALASEPRLALASEDPNASPVAAVHAGRVMIGRVEDDGAGGAWAWVAADSHEHGSVGNAAELLALLP